MHEVPSSEMDNATLAPSVTSRHQEAASLHPHGIQATFHERPRNADDP